MKFLLDENLSVKTAIFVKNLGFDVVHTSEAKLSGKPDSAIYEFCADKGHVLITYDTDFSYDYISRKDLPGLIVAKIPLKQLNFCINY